jgi:L-glyceraldehyde 3-phosphate reductase
MGTPLLIHQPSYSMFNRWIESGLLDALEEVGAGCITFSPLAQGLLTDRYLDGVPDDSRGAAGKTLFDAHLSDENIERVRALAAIAERRGQTLAQMAVSWTLRDPRVTTTLLGASSVRQLEETAAAVHAAQFTDEELAEIDTYAVEADINLWAAQSLIP